MTYLLTISWSSSSSVKFQHTHGTLSTLILIALLTFYSTAHPYHQRPSHHKRQSVLWVTNYVTQTIDITTTIWVQEGFVPPSASSVLSDKLLTSFLSGRQYCLNFLSRTSYITNFLIYCIRLSTVTFNANADYICCYCCIRVRYSC